MADHRGRRAPRSGLLAAIAAVVFFSGAVFGYDQGAISGALTSIRRSFGVGTFAVESAASLVTLGALAGALAGGHLADRFGRRTTLLLAAALLAAGALGQAVSPQIGVLLAARLVMGAGVGVASVAGPMYAAELAPHRIRGSLTALFQLSITAALFLGFLVDVAANPGRWWRLTLGSSALLAAGLALLMLRLPDSPVSDLRRGRHDAATRALRRVLPPDQVDQRMNGIQASLAATPAGWGEIFSRRWRRPLLLGVGLALFQQLTGINGIVFYADEIFDAAGFHSAAAQLSTTAWSIGGINTLFTLLAVLTLDRLGRRPLLLGGLATMAVALAGVSVCFRLLHDGRGGLAGAGLLAAVALFIAAYAASIGPVTWTVINEIYPTRLRGRSVALAVGTHWGSEYVITQFFLSTLDALGAGGVFALYAAASVLGFFFVRAYLPETKGRTLEQIQQMWSPPAARR